MLYFIDVIKDFESLNHVGSQSSVLNLKWWQSNIFQAFCVAQMLDIFYQFSRSSLYIFYLYSFFFIYQRPYIAAIF